MTPLFIIGINLAVLTIAIFALRAWLHRQSDTFSISYRLYGIVMWLGCLVAIAAAVFSFIEPHPYVYSMSAASGALVATNMSMLRKKLVRQRNDKHKKTAV
jgi:predicted tellurium resistance membrane protein TerC